MGLFGTRKDTIKDPSSPAAVGGTTPSRQGSNTKKKSKIANLFSDDGTGPNEDTVLALDGNGPQEDRSAVPTITMDDFNCGGRDRERSVALGAANGNPLGDGRMKSPRHRDLKRMASRQEGIMQRANSISRLSSRNSIKRSVSIKIARSESRRHNLLQENKENRDSKHKLNEGEKGLATGARRGQLGSFLAGLSLSGDSSPSDDHQSRLQQNEKNMNATCRDKLFEAVPESIENFEKADDGDDLYLVEEATKSDPGGMKVDTDGVCVEIVLSPENDHCTSEEAAPSPPLLGIPIQGKSVLVPNGKAVKARRRPPPLNHIETPNSTASTASEAPKTTVFGVDGGFITGGFEITADGMIGMPPIATREDSDTDIDGQLPQSENLIIIRSLKEFQVGPTIGAGAAGRVYLADHIPSRRTMAIKVVNVYDKGTRHQLLKELQTLCTYVSRYLVRFYGAFYDGSGAMHIALEFMDHGCLSTFVQRVGSIPEKIVQMIASDCLRGLRFLHRHHVLHRDFKTANILLSRRQCCAKLSDFGLARDLNQGVSRVDTFVGTVAYMSPERLHGSEYTYASDIWALGVSIVECLLGRYPFDRPRNYFDYIDATMTPDVWKDCEQGGLGVSREARDFVNLCTFADPQERPNAVALLEHPWLRGVKRDSDLFGTWLDHCRILSMRVATQSPQPRKR